MIPRIIHQTWIDENVPQPLEQLAESWRHHHPDWQYKLWTDIDNRAFVAENFPDFLNHYDAYPHPIQRVDAVRYMILLKLGGVFVDLDFEARRPLDPLLTSGCVFGAEPMENCAAHGKELIVSNAFMAAPAGHQFFGELVQRLPMQQGMSADQNQLVLETTGPFFLTRIYQTYERDDPITILPAEAIFPLSIFDIERLRRSGWHQDLVDKTAAAYAIHYHAGTWWRRS